MNKIIKIAIQIFILICLIQIVSAQISQINDSNIKIELNERQLSQSKNNQYDDNHKRRIYHYLPKSTKYKNKYKDDPPPEPKPEPEPEPEPKPEPKPEPEPEPKPEPEPEPKPEPKPEPEPEPKPEPEPEPKPEPKPEPEPEPEPKPDPEPKKPDEGVDNPNPPTTLWERLWWSSEQNLILNKGMIIVLICYIILSFI